MIRCSLFGLILTRTRTRRRRRIIMIRATRQGREEHERHNTCFIQKIYDPLFKLNIYPFPLPHFSSIFFAYLWSFRWPNYIVTLPRYFSFRLPHLNISTGPPQTNWTRIVSECGLLKISFNETDTTTSGLRWIFHMHSEFSRPAMCNNPTRSSPLKCKVSL